jgi:hypothetical protein
VLFQRGIGQKFADSLFISQDGMPGQFEVDELADVVPVRVFSADGQVFRSHFPVKGRQHFVFVAWFEEAIIRRFWQIVLVIPTASHNAPPFVLSRNLAT